MAVEEDLNVRCLPATPAAESSKRAQAASVHRTPMLERGTSVAARVKEFEDLQATAGVTFSIAEALDRFSITAEQRDCLAKRCAELQRLYASAKDDLTVQLSEALQQRDAARAESARHAAIITQLQGNAQAVGHGAGAQPDSQRSDDSSQAQAKAENGAEVAYMKQLKETLKQRDSARDNASEHLHNLSRLQEMMEAGWLVVPASSDAPSMEASAVPPAESAWVQPQQPRAAQQDGSTSSLLGRMAASVHFGGAQGAPSPSSPPAAIPAQQPAHPNPPVSRPEPANARHSADEDLSSLSDSQLEALAKQIQATQERRVHDQDELLQCILEDLGFHGGLPIAALLIFRAALHWRSFQTDSATFFDRVIDTIRLQVKSHSEDTAFLAYWLTTHITLLSILRQSVKSAPSAVLSRSSPSASPARRGSLFEATAGAFSSLFSRPSPVPSASQQAEDEAPAALFAQQLDASVQDVFFRLWYTTQVTLESQLMQCMDAAQKRPDNDRGPAGLSQHWQAVLNTLSTLLEVLQAAHVPSPVAQTLLQEAFGFVDRHLFNSLLGRRECCTFRCAEYLAAGLSELEHWVHKSGELWAGQSLEQLQHISQAVIFLTLEDKQTKSREDIIRTCPALSMRQLHRVAIMYWDDSRTTQTVSQMLLQDVLIQLKDLAEEAQTADGRTLLLDSRSYVPPQLDDVQESIDSQVVFGELPMPPLLSNSLRFSFLGKDLQQPGAM